MDFWGVATGGELQAHVLRPGLRTDGCRSVPRGLAAGSVWPPSADG